MDKPMTRGASRSRTEKGDGSGREGLIASGVVPQLKFQPEFFDQAGQLAAYQKVWLNASMAVMDELVTFAFKRQQAQMENWVRCWEHPFDWQQQLERQQRFCQDLAEDYAAESQNLASLTGSLLAHTTETEWMKTFAQSKTQFMERRTEQQSATEAEAA